MPFPICTELPGASTWLAMPATRCVVPIVLALTLAACHRQAPLAPELAAIKCPADRTEHASTKFGKAELTFVCISERLASTPHMLRCDLDSRPMVCEDAGTFVFSRSAEGKVYSGSLPKFVQERESIAPDAPHGSQLIVNFRNAPPRTSTFEEVETDWRFLLPEARDLLPPGFTFVKGALCDREATVLNTGSCNLEARSASLYWHISVYIPVEKGTPISAGEYREELAFWLKVLDKVVVDPGK
ncbi:MAG: hypothetical protein IPP91_10810 [Betaproteobacteria bacterium]|nr:hypothetical protein [Betaproteobacteria bacterium]